MNQIPEFGFLTLEQIIGRPEVTPEEAAENKRLGRRPWRARAPLPAIIPIGKSSWEIGIRTGLFPAPRRIGRLRVWPVEQIRELSREIAEGKAPAKIAIYQGIPYRTPKADDLPPLEADELLAIEATEYAERGDER